MTYVLSSRSSSEFLLAKWIGSSTHNQKKFEENRSSIMNTETLMNSLIEELPSLSRVLRPAVPCNSPNREPQEAPTNRDCNIAIILEIQGLAMEP